MSKEGHDFKKDVNNILKKGFETMLDYLASVEEDGRRREIDIVAKSQVPPFGDVYFLIECKELKISEENITYFKEKIDSMKTGLDQYSDGIPIMISLSCATPGAVDEAKKSGIRLLTMDQLKEVASEIRIPRDVEKNFESLQAQYLNFQYLNFSIEEIGNLTVTKAETFYNVRGLEDFELYVELKKGKVNKDTVLVFGKYIGPIDIDEIRHWIQKIDGYRETQRVEGKKIKEIIIGFFTNKVLDEDDKKLMNKLTKSTRSLITLISGDLKKGSGNADALKFFNVNLLMKKTTD